ncbi:helix-turn-helix domain-containing protein [Enterococcus cecorum]|uniref:helix-turn-helix domain-containing protein n=1 Tax=Enterococcus cecorum TaxID=44008 RepID=UPI001FABC460|nr:helix-turn-helix domain-containing protein [Enterococcus cecorum]MCJ0586570.1 helix-turn-helix domain-containing protein [Enterococcus cecorum]MCJ0591248.1 helix-turn-helix domain-containing protein [Enterococcus cecorum]
MQGSVTLILSQLDAYFRRVIREEVAAALKANQTTDAYSQKETAKILGMSEATLISERKKGRIRAYESGRHVMYTTAEINKYREKNTI